MHEAGATQLPYYYPDYFFKKVFYEVLHYRHYVEFSDTSHWPVKKNFIKNKFELIKPGSQSLWHGLQI